MKKMNILLMLSCLFLVLGIVFVAGCLDESNDSNEYKNSPINPLHKNIEPFESTSFYENALENNIILYKVWENCSVTYASNESLISNSDLVFYGTLKSIDPSYWSTPGQQPPSGLYAASVGQITVGYENGTQIKYNQVSIGGVNDYICTPLVFEVNDFVKGENTTTVTAVV